MRGRKPEKTKTNRSTPAGRVAYLLEHRWRGRCSEMARELKIAPSSLSRVVRGERPPGRDLLARIAQHASVNAGWLLTGMGEPFLSSDAAPPRALPLLDLPLAGPIEEQSQLLARGRLELTKLFTPSSYCLAVRPAHPAIVAWPGEVHDGDVLVLETDASRWREEPGFVEGRICVRRRHTADGRIVDWVKPANDRSGELIVSSLAPIAKSSAKSPSAAGPRRRGFLDGDPATKTASAHESLELSEIVAVCRVILRSTGAIGR